MKDRFSTKKSAQDDVTAGRPQHAPERNAPEPVPSFQRLPEINRGERMNPRQLDLHLDLLNMGTGGKSSGWGRSTRGVRGTQMSRLRERVCPPERAAWWFQQMRRAVE